MTWRVARSLDVLLAEVNAAAPNRSKISDGALGDAAHASRDSDHNPFIKVGNVGIVRARDFTHDSRGGLDCDRLAAGLAPLLGVHPAMKSGAYIIWNRRIISADRIKEGWRAYTGSNGHTKHLHVSVTTKASGFDSTAKWGMFAPPVRPSRLPRIRRALRREIDATKPGPLRRAYRRAARALRPKR